jgi:hypothetical protein
LVLLRSMDAGVYGAMTRKLSVSLCVFVLNFIETLLFPQYDSY